MLSDKMIELISRQIKNEYESAYLYLEIADYYTTKNLLGFSNWFLIQAREEEDHAIIFYNYLHSNNASIDFYNIESSNNKFPDLISPLKETLMHEEFITSSINKIYELAEKEHDFRTKNFLNWFIEEQQEEEENAYSLISNMETFGSDLSGLYQLDREYFSRTYKKCNKLKKISL